MRPLPIALAAAVLLTALLSLSLFSPTAKTLREAKKGDLSLVCLFAGEEQPRTVNPTLITSFNGYTWTFKNGSASRCYTTPRTNAN